MTRSSTTLMISSSSSSSLRLTVSCLCAESARGVGTLCRSRAASTLLQLLQSVSSTSGSWWSRDPRWRTRRNGTDVSLTLPARLSITSFPVAAWLQCACRRKSGTGTATCRTVSRSSLSSSLKWSWMSRSSHDCRSWTCSRQSQECISVTSQLNITSDERSYWLMSVSHACNTCKGSTAPKLR